MPATDTPTETPASNCDCGAPTDGKWAGIHSPRCPAAYAPTVIEIARIIGRTRTDLDDGCDASCDTDGGTCICAELYAPAAKKIVALFKNTPKAA